MEEDKLEEFEQYFYQSNVEGYEEKSLVCSENLICGNNVIII